jgi:hypothetical protein
MKHSLSNTLNRIVRFKEIARKQRRYLDETEFRVIELKIIKRMNNSDNEKENL